MLKLRFKEVGGSGGSLKLKKKFLNNFDIKILKSRRQ